MLRGAAIFVFLAGLAYGQPGPPPLTLGRRAWVYTEATIGPASVASSALSAAINQWRDVPTEWGQGGAGYGRRFASGMAVDAASNAVEFAVSALRREDPRWVLSREKRFWRRARYIIVNTYRVPRQNGGRTFAWSRVCGALTGGFVVNAWYPPSGNTPGEALIRSGWALAADMGNSAFHEFWPDVKRIVFRKK